MSAPLVTVVTPCFNAAATLAATVESVLGQTYRHLEYIVMDACSTDDTGELIARYSGDPRLTFVSEPDEGQSDAINKGWRRSKGEVLAWLCADDRYLPSTVETAVEYLTTHPEAGWVYGRDRYINAEGEPVPFNHLVEQWDYERFRQQALYVSQPTAFWRREVVSEFGELRTDLHYAMDMEFLLRIGNRYSGHLIERLMAEITWTRATKTFGGGRDRLLEIFRLHQEYGGSGDLASNIRTEWVETHLRETARAVRNRDLPEARRMLGLSARYPSNVPKGVLKLALRSLLSEQAETRLRRLLLRSMR